MNKFVQILVSTIITCVIFFSNNLLLAQDEVEFNGFILKPKFRFEEVNYKQYKSFVFEIPKDIDSINVNSLKINVYIKIKDAVYANPEKVDIVKNEFTDFIIFTFKTLNKYNILKIGDVEFPVSKLQIWKAEKSEIFSSLYIYYTKKDLESFNQKNIDSKLIDIDTRLNILGHNDDDPIYNEIMAYYYDLFTKFRYPDSIKFYYNKSYELGNRETAFLKNYSNYYYKEASILFQNTDFEKNSESLNQVANMLNTVVSNYPYQDEVISNSKYMLASTFYYINEVKKDVDATEFILKMTNYLDGIVSNPKDINKCKALLLLGNSYYLINDNLNSLIYYEKVIDKNNNCSEKLSKLAEQYIKETNENK